MLGDLASSGEAQLSFLSDREVPAFWTVAASPPFPLLVFPRKHVTEHCWTALLDYNKSDLRLQRGAGSFSQLVSWRRVSDSLWLHVWWPKHCWLCPAVWKIFPGLFSFTRGIFATLGHFYGVEVGVPFVAALLTILGYSVNDTIVVYDRIRENVLRTRSIADFEGLVNKSLNETIARSFNTSFTVVLVLVPIILFGGETLFNFSLALLIGVLFGTYSSMFIATALIVSIYKMQKKSTRKMKLII